MTNKKNVKKERRTIRRSDEYKKALETGSKILAEKMAEVR